MGNKIDENSETTGGFNSAFGLWNGRGKVAYSTYAKEDIFIPKGAKIIVFRVEDATQENRKPALNVVYVVESE